MLLKYYSATDILLRGSGVSVFICAPYHLGSSPAQCGSGGPIPRGGRVSQGVCVCVFVCERPRSEAADCAAHNLRSGGAQFISTCLSCPRVATAAMSADENIRLPRDRPQSRQGGQGVERLSSGCCKIGEVATPAWCHLMQNGIFVLLWLHLVMTISRCCLF